MCAGMPVSLLRTALRGAETRTARRWIMEVEGEGTGILPGLNNRVGVGTFGDLVEDVVRRFMRGPPRREQ